MPIRSMTGFAQVRSQIAVAANDSSEQLAFTLSLKSVNHRYLDLQMRMPSDTDGLEMKLRRLLKERVARGHVDLTLSIDRGTVGAMQLNKDMVAGYVRAFRDAAKEFAVVPAEPDLNAILRMPGALTGAVGVMDGAFENAVLARAEEAIVRLNEMREEEGRGMEHELRRRMAALSSVTDEVAQLRSAVSRAYLEKVQSRMNELIAGKADADRILQEAAMLAERSDIEEELVRLKTHIRHFLGLLDTGGEVGKKLDFLLQELNREANTLLSKTSGVAGEGLRITELGLAMKSEIEKAREQIQNIE
ncbi:MAG: hypothetical protein JWN45_2048 [Acidobacteriaceae bacterium]|nr:hypothetical protein [Acidobacteriaceae bacterium]